jgi:hypothetical protein
MKKSIRVDLQQQAICFFYNVYLPVSGMKDVWGPVNLERYPIFVPGFDGRG